MSFSWEGVRNDYASDSEIRLVDFLGMFLEIFYVLRIKHSTVSARDIGKLIHIFERHAKSWK